MGAQDVELRYEVHRLKSRVGSLTAIVSGSAFDTGVAEFITVAEMLADAAVNWGIAACSNYFPGDNTLSVWVRFRTSPLIANGTNRLAASDGSLLWRASFTEYEDPDIIVPPATGTPYNVSVSLIFPTFIDAANSHVNVLSFEVFDDDEIKVGFKRDPTAAAFGVQNVDWIVNAVGVYYKRIT